MMLEKLLATVGLIYFTFCSPVTAELCELWASTSKFVINVSEFMRDLDFRNLCGASGSLSLFVGGIAS